MVRKISLLAVLMVLEATLCHAAPAGGKWVLPNFAQRLDLTVTNPGGTPVKTLVTLPVARLARVALGFPGSLAIAVIKDRPGSRYSITVIPSQADDLDGDNMKDEFEFPISLLPHESKQVEIYFSTTLHNRIVYPRGVHASHHYGYNHQTAALGSKVIGYRTYGGFFLDIQGRVAGHQGFYNDLNGFLAAHDNFAVGKDIFHVGNTLGLGGLFLERNGTTYRPPMNVPDYAHKPSPPVVPHYRVLADGPLRAVIEATLNHWQIGDDEVDLRAWYSIDTGKGFVRCRVEIIPTKMREGHVYRVGAGIRDMPDQKFRKESGLLMLSGEQKPQIGRLGLALYFNPEFASASSPIMTADGKNEDVIFDQVLSCGRAVTVNYAVAAGWSKSGIPDLLHYLAGMQGQVNTKVTVSDERLERTPQSQRIEGEAY